MDGQEVAVPQAAAESNAESKDDDTEVFLKDSLHEVDPLDLERSLMQPMATPKRPSPELPALPSREECAEALAKEAALEEAGANFAHLPALHELAKAHPPQPATPMEAARLQEAARLEAARLADAARPPESPCKELPDSLPYEQIKLVFTDLDGTLYPGTPNEPEPKNKRLGLLKNMEAVHALEAMGVPVILATGNNVGFAQRKFLNPADGTLLLRLSSSPGIYCNGAYVKGAGGKDILVSALGPFLHKFVDKCLAAPPPKCCSKCMVGLGKERTFLLQHPDLNDEGRRTGDEFVAAMMMEPDQYDWLEPEDFKAQSESILSMPLLCPRDSSEEDLLEYQSWLHDNDLIRFAEARGRKSGGEGASVVCKHVHVPGIGPEIDVSPAGVNKGSAVAILLQDTMAHLGITCEGSQDIAVFGDAGNDIELFGMKKNREGTALEPLGLPGVSFRPAIRVAMPWANDGLLLEDCNVVATVDKVLQKVVASRADAN